MEGSLTATLALWGAALSTATAAWNFSKWRRDRPRLSVKIRHEERPFGEVIVMTIRNRGEKPTTVEEVMLVYHRRGLARIFFTPQTVEYLSAMHPAEVKLPAKLAYGDVWRAHCEFDPVAKAIDGENKSELLAQGRLFYYVRCAHSDRLIRGRVRQDTFELFE